MPAPVSLEARVELLTERREMTKKLPKGSSPNLPGAPVVGFGGCAWEGVEWETMVTSKVRSPRRGGGASRIRVLTTARKKN